MQPTRSDGETRPRRDAAHRTAPRDAGPRTRDHAHGTTHGTARVAAALPPLAAAIGVAVAFAIVVAWFPKSVFTMPIQSSDAPGHYYFIGKLMDEGPGAALRLWPNDTFYPPLFHILAALCSAVAGLVTGTPLGVYAAMSVAWIVSSGLLFPIGMALLCACLLRRLDLPAWLRALLLALAPVLAVSSACHPYLLLDAGPLVAYGFAMSLLPYLLAASLRLLDAIDVVLIVRRRTRTPRAEARAAARAAHVRTPRFLGARTIADPDAAAAAHRGLGGAHAGLSAVRPMLGWLAVTAAAGAVMLLAHPRALFTYALLMLPFIVLRLPWRFVAAALGVMAAGGAAFVVFMFATFKSERYADPASWFHTHRPSKSLVDALHYALAGGLDGVAGDLFAVLLLAAAAAGVIGAASGVVRRTMIALTAAFAAVVLIYAATVTWTGALANIVTAPWYRDENRIVTMLPLVAVPLAIAGVGVACRAAGFVRRTDPPVVPPLAPDARTLVAAHAGRVRDDGGIGRVPREIAVPMAMLLVAVAVMAQFGTPSRDAVAQRITANTALTGTDPVEQLTEAKVDVLRQAVARAGRGATIVSDPMNGSMYATSLFGADMLYPIMNAQGTGPALALAETETSFASGDGKRLLATVCPIRADKPEYFLTMGDQATSLQSFPYKAQYDTFHDQALIDAYVQGGTLVKVADYGAYGDGWALYRFGCGD